MTHRPFLANFTNTGRFRKVPLPDQAAGALDRLSRRDSCIGPDVLYYRRFRQLDKRNESK
jgi:hypothetical protein